MYQSFSSQHGVVITKTEMKTKRRGFFLVALSLTKEERSPRLQSSLIPFDLTHTTLHQRRALLLCPLRRLMFLSITPHTVPSRPLQSPMYWQGYRTRTGATMKQYGTCCYRVGPSSHHSFLQEDVDCPLCLEEMDLSDINFKPCPCGYQVRALIVYVAHQHTYKNFAN